MMGKLQKIRCSGIFRSYRMRQYMFAMHAWYEMMTKMKVTHEEEVVLTLALAVVARR